MSLDSHSAAFCVQTCSTHEDCPPRQSCRTDLLPSMDGVCWGFCESDSRCRTNDRCDLRAGVCKPFCDPEGAGLPDAIACAADEACAPVGGAAHGFCEPLGRLCGTDEECHGSQACEMLADDRRGRCVDGCVADADCTGSGAGCKVQPGSSFGVCRAPGGTCSPGSGFDARGDAQCMDSQRCSTTVAYELGTCVDR